MPRTKQFAAYTRVFEMVSKHAVDFGCLRGRYLEPFWCGFNLQGTVQAKLMYTRLFWFNNKSSNSLRTLLVIAMSVIYVSSTSTYMYCTLRLYSWCFCILVCCSQHNGRWCVFTHNSPGGGAQYSFLFFRWLLRDFSYCI